MRLRSSPPRARPDHYTAARYDGAVSARAMEDSEDATRLPWLRRAAMHARGEVLLTALAIWRGITGIYSSNDLTFASSIAYYALLSLFPFFLLELAILASVTNNETERTSVLDFVFRYFPRQFDFVNTQLKAMQQAGVRLGIVGSILMVWAAMGVFSAITSAVNHAWGVEKQPSYLKHKMMAFIMLVAASLLLLVALLLVSAINVAEARWFAVILTRVPALLVLQGWALKSASTVIFIVL